MVKKKIKQSPKLPAETRRAQLLEAAWKLFVRDGYRQTTVDQIAQKAGLTKGALYFHFKSKEDIFYELIREFSDKHIEQFLKSVKQDATLAEIADLQLNIHSKGKAPEYWDVVDLWVQAVRIPRIKRLIGRKHREMVARSAEKLSREYGRTLERRKELTQMTMAWCKGLAFIKTLGPRNVNVGNQIRILETILKDCPQVSGKRAKQGKDTGLPL